MPGKTSDKIDDKEQELINKYLTPSSDHPEDVFYHFKDGIIIDTNDVFIVNRPLDQIVNVKPIIAKIMGGIHFSDMQSKTEYYSGEKKNKTVHWMNDDLRQLTGCLKEDGSRQPAAVSTFTAIASLQNISTTAMNELCSYSGDPYSRDAMSLCLGRLAGVGPIPKPDGWGYGNRANTDQRSWPFDSNNITTLPCPLRGILPGYTRGTSKTATAEKVFNEKIYLPEGKSVPFDYNHKSKSILSISNVYSNYIQGRSALRKYITAQHANAHQEMIRVGYLPANQGLVDTQDDIVFARDVNTSDIFVGGNLNYLEEVPSSAALLEALIEKRVELEAANYPGQISIFEEVVNRVRDGSIKGQQEDDMVEIEDGKGRFLKLHSEDDDGTRGYKDAGDIFISQHWLPHICELILKIKIKPGVGNGIVEEGEAEGAAEGEAEGAAEGEGGGNEEGVGEAGEQSNVNADLIYRIVAQGLNWFDDDDEEEESGNSVKETQAALEKLYVKDSKYGRHQSST